MMLELGFSLAGEYIGRPDVRSVEACCGAPTSTCATVPSRRYRRATSSRLVDEHHAPLRKDTSRERRREVHLAVAVQPFTHHRQRQLPTALPIAQFSAACSTRTPVPTQPSPPKRRVICDAPVLHELRVFVHSGTRARAAAAAVTPAATSSVLFLC